MIDSTGDGSRTSGSGVRRRSQFLVETPEFSSIDWKSVGFIFITNYNHMLALHLMLLNIRTLKKSLRNGSICKVKFLFNIQHYLRL